jgi:hypothetical protein
MTEAHPLTDSHNHGNFTDDENSIESANTTNDGNDGFAYERLQDQCRSCERELASRIARVCGDNDGCVPVCDECAPTVSETRRNTAAIAHAHRNKTSTAGNNCSTPLFTQQSDSETETGGDE